MIALVERQRPNPDGWKGGPEEYDTLWQSHGHRIDSMGAYLDDHGGEGDPCIERGYTLDHSYPNAI